MRTKSVLLLVMLALVLAAPAIAVKEPFQDYTGGYSIIAGGAFTTSTNVKYGLVSYPKPETKMFYMKGTKPAGGLTNSYLAIGYSSAQVAANWTAVTYAKATTPTAPRYYFEWKNSGGTTLISYVGSGIPIAYTTTRWYFRYASGHIYVYQDGKYIADAGACAIAPSYFYIGIYSPGSVNEIGGEMYIDDYAINPTTLSYMADMNFEENLPTDYYVVVDSLGASSGLYNASGLQDSNLYYNTFSSTNNGTKKFTVSNFLTGTVYETLYKSGSYGNIAWNISKLATATTGLTMFKMEIPGYGVSFTDFFWLTSYGATISFDKDSYIIGDTATLTYNIDGAYWDTATYEYYIYITDVFGTTLYSTQITSQTGSASDLIDDATYGTKNLIYGMVKRKTKATGTYEIMVYDWAEIDRFLLVEGYTMDAKNGVPLTNVNVSLAQTGISTQYILSDMTGFYNFSGMAVDTPISIAANVSEYRMDGFSFTPYEQKTYHINLSFYKSEVDYIPTMIRGIIRSSDYYQPIGNATIYAYNATWNAHTFSNAWGYYEFQNLVNANSTYWLSATHPNYTAVTGEAANVPYY